MERLGRVGESVQEEPLQGLKPRRPADVGKSPHLPFISLLLLVPASWDWYGSTPQAQEPVTPWATISPRMAKSFDVFLSHNSKDKPDVRELAEALRARGLRVWLDECELVP